MLYRRFTANTKRVPLAGLPSNKRPAIPPTRLEALLRVYDRRVLDSFKAHLDDAPPAVAKKVGPLLGLLFNPLASDIQIEFRPDEFTITQSVTYPSGDVAPRTLPLGAM